MTIPRTTPGSWCAGWRGRIPECVAFAGSDGAAFRGPASRAFWPRARHTPPSSTQGFKILLDIIATGRGELRIKEIPYAFGSRLHGESKLDSMVALDFLGLLLAKLTHDVVSLRFLLFATVGSLELLVHFAALYTALETFDFPFPEAQAFGAF